MSILLACSFDESEWAAWPPSLRQALPGQTWLRAENAGTFSAAERAAVDIAIVANPRPGQLAGYPNLRLIQSLWAGVDRLLDDPTLPADVPLVRMVDPAMSAAMAETALWATLSLHRGFFIYTRQQAGQVWQQHEQRRADEVQVLIAGLGELGRTVAHRLLRNGYRVSAWRRGAVGADTGDVGSSEPGAPGRWSGLDSHTGADVDGLADLADFGQRWHQGAGAEAWQALAAQADVVINLMPLTWATQGFFDAARFAGFRRGAGFVNLARGAAVVDADLIAALDAGQLGHAVLDVFRREPLATDHPFWRHPGVTVLPHVAALTDPRSASLVAAANVRALRSLAPGDRAADVALIATLRGAVDRQRGY